jgi:beta-glucanase (GH16 family)
VEVRAKFPPQNTGTWPAIWLLGANCQAANLVNGSEAVAFDGCPAQGDPAYQEIDMVECDSRSWCHVVVAQGSSGWSSLCAFPVDANWHVFKLTWDATKVTMAVDGNATGCSFSNKSLHGPMFLIMQTQTTSSSGVAGLPDNANLPTTFQIDYVKVTQP